MTAMVFLVALAATPTSTPIQAATAEVEQLVARFDAARAAYDPAALAATLSPDFVEISPLGDVDERGEVLGFYAPEKRGPVPPMTTAERRVVVRGAVAIETELKSFTMARPGSAAVTRSVRARYVAVREGGGWRLLSAQYTPVPPAK